MSTQVRLSLLDLFSSVHFEELGIGRQRGLVQGELRLVEIVEEVLLLEKRIVSGWLAARREQCLLVAEIATSERS